MFNEFMELHQFYLDSQAHQEVARRENMKHRNKPEKRKRKPKR